MVSILIKTGDTGSLLGTPMGRKSPVSPEKLNIVIMTLKREKEANFGIKSKDYDTFTRQFNYGSVGGCISRANR